MINKLYESVISACDRLHANKELINRKTVKNLLVEHGAWSDLGAVLEPQISEYINQWRLQNLTLNSQVHGVEEVLALKAQVDKYRYDLLQAKKIIAKLKLELRGMLNAAG